MVENDASRLKAGCSKEISTLYDDRECLRVDIHSLYRKTRFGPNIPAADMEGNGEFDF